MRGKELTTALNNTPIVDAASILGVRLLSPHGNRCPFSDHDDKNPSFQILPNGTYWICYGCDRRGGAIDFVKTYLGINFLEAKKILHDADVHPGRVFGSLQGKRRQKSLNKNIKAGSPLLDETPPDNDLYETFLNQNPLQTAGKLYLNSRMISDLTIHQNRIGQISNSNTKMSNLIDNYGFNRVQASGLLTKRSSVSNWRSAFSDNSILFPYLDQGKVVYFQSRLLNVEDKSQRWRNLTGRRHQLYNLDGLNSGAKKIGICEGVVDTLSAIELGYSAVGLMGVGASFTEENILSLIGKSVDILLDWDAQGENKSKQLLHELRSKGVAAVRMNLNDTSINDLNDFLVKARS